MKGKLIVLEGIDGSGKSTNYKMICDKLNKDNINFTKISFPRYDNDSSALIRLYLSGEFGSNPNDVNAYAASTFYAVDRFASYKKDWGEGYNNGELILSDRYTTSNIVHQGSKLDGNELIDYFKWIEEFEFNKIGIPSPDLVIYLDCDIETSIKRMRKRENETNTHADIHEKDVEYLKKCLATASLACDFFGWNRIGYEDNGIERSIEEKNDEIYKIIKKFITENNN